MIELKPESQHLAAEATYEIALGPNEKKVSLSGGRSVRLPPRGAASKGKFSGRARSVEQFLQDRKEIGAL